MSRESESQARAIMEAITKMVAALQVDYGLLEELRSARERCGSVISGTMRPQDVIPALLEVLREEDEKAYTQMMEQSFGPPAYAEENENSPWWYSEEALALKEELIEALNDCAHPYCYFGAHPDDGADLGFWMDEETDEELRMLEEAAGDCSSEEEALERIHEMPISVEIRSGWVSTGSLLSPAEYRIVLCTGGPHVEIRGELDNCGAPATASLLHQGWFEELREYEEADKEVLLSFASRFYFGE